MFVIVHDNNVIFGPKNWNKLNFQEVILEDCEVECNLDTRNDARIQVIINDSIKILPVVGLPQPEFNGNIQRLEGPYWNFYDDRAEMYYTVGDLPVDAVRNFYKERVAAERYIKEVSGFDYTINDMIVRINTSRDGRNTYIQNIVIMNDGDTVNWKFNRDWITLTKTDLSDIIGKINQHVQNSFNWEAGKFTEIDNATSLQELDSIILTIEQ
jgi:hypothetical protein